MNPSLVDRFELQRTEFRPKAVTLVDPFELRERLESVDFEFEWESPTRDECLIVVESAPRGVTYEAWRRARAWGH